MLACVCQLRYSPCYHLEELVLPYVVELIYLLISSDTVVGEIIDKVLGCLLVFLSNHSSRFSSSMSIIFIFFLTYFFLANFRREYVWCWQYLIKVLELLSCFESIRVGDCHSIDFCYIGEPVDNKCSNKNGAWDFIVIDTKRR